MAVVRGGDIGIVITGWQSDPSLMGGFGKTGSIVLPAGPFEQIENGAEFPAYFFDDIPRSLQNSKLLVCNDAEVV